MAKRRMLQWMRDRVRGKQGHADHHRLRGRSIEQMCVLQGLPRDFLSDAPFTKQAKSIVIGNGVPLTMGRAVAKAVKRALTVDLKVAV
jgi:site-specific DNA-cytosine methylase